MKTQHLHIAKIFAAGLCAAFLAASVFAGGRNDSAEQTAPAQTEAGGAASSSVAAGEIRVGILNGPTSIPVAYMLDAGAAVDGKSLSFETFATPQALLPKMIRGEIDIGFMPANVAAKTYTDGNRAVLCAGVSGNGNVFLVTKDKSVASLSDLAGKTVNVAGQGATPEYLFRWLLEKNNVPDVALDFGIPTADIAAELISDRIACAVVPEPFATVATVRSSDVVRAIDFQNEFSAASGLDTYPLTVMVVRREYAESNPESVRAFGRAFNESYLWTVAHPQEAGELVQKHTLGLMAPIVAAAIPHANFTWKTAADARQEIENLLSIFLDFAPDSIGGKVPDDGFYFR